MPSRMNHAAWMLLSCLALALPAQAAEPRYTYGEIGYINADFDDIDEDGDGFGVGGSLAVHRNIHLVADYWDIDLDGDAEANALSLGVGGNYALRPGLDLVGRLRWINQEVEVGRFNEDEDGYGFDVGLRTMINAQLELNGTVKYVDIDDEDDTSVQVGALYDVVPNLALGGDIEFSDDYTALVLRARYYFAGF